MAIALSATFRMPETVISGRMAIVGKTGSGGQVLAELR